MRKTYPYLQESYSPNLNEEQEKRNFLALLDDFVNQRQYINMTLLDWNENPLQEIDGIITSGTINKDGASAVRRTCSLSCSVDGGSYNVDSLDMLFSLNKKIFIEIGIKNETDQYSEYPILWFPQGVFYINNFSMNSSTSSAVNINLSLKDKISLLNGDVGGTLPATVQFDVMDTQISTGEWVQQKVLIYEIISELVNHYGGEDLNNIIIEDVPLRIRKIMQWIGDVPLYGYISEPDEDGNPEQWTFQLEKPFTTSENIAVHEYNAGMDVGYIYSDFVLTDELVGSAGDTVCTILDKIKNILGNYEYFYDEMGIFHFREIRNFLNINQSSYNEEKQNDTITGRYLNIQGGKFNLDINSEKQYLIETTNKKSLYSFSDNHNITSISVSPNYSNIKNDYIIEGLRKSTTSDIAYIVRYHLAIDDLPEKNYQSGDEWYYGCFNNLVYYTDELDGLNKLGFSKEVEELPEVGNFDQIYRLKVEKNNSLIEENIIPEIIQDDSSINDSPSQGTNTAATDNSSTDTENIATESSWEFYYWDNGYKKLYYIDESIDTLDQEQKRIEPKFYDEYLVKDWRTYLYIYGLAANELGLDAGPYFQELQAFWPGEYNLQKEKQCFFGEDEETKEVRYYTLTTGNYYLDFIDSSSALLGEYSIKNIGRRTDAVIDEEINCLFQPEIPDIIFLNKDNPLVNWTENTTGTFTYEEIEEMYNNVFSETDGEDVSHEDKILALQRKECNDNYQPYTQISEEVYNNLAIGGYANGAYDLIKYELFCHTNYQKTISLTTLPVFYLEPNSRVELSDSSTNTFGDFMVQNISLTLGPGANMAVTLNQVNERL